MEDIQHDKSELISLRRTALRIVLLNVFFCLLEVAEYAVGVYTFPHHWVGWGVAAGPGCAIGGAICARRLLPRDLSDEQRMREAEARAKEMPRLQKQGAALGGVLVPVGNMVGMPAALAPLGGLQTGFLVVYLAELIRDRLRRGPVVWDELARRHRVIRGGGNPAPVRGAASGEGRSSL